MNIFTGLFRWYHQMCNNNTYNTHLIFLISWSSRVLQYCDEHISKPNIFRFKTILNQFFFNIHISDYDISIWLIKYNIFSFCFTNVNNFQLSYHCGNCFIFCCDYLKLTNRNTHAIYQECGIACLWLANAPQKLASFSLLNH